MSDQGYQHWQKKANEIRVQPSDRVWERLEKRLDQDQGKVQITIVRRWTTIAACLVFVLATAAFIYNINRSEEQHLTMLEELEEPVPTPSFAVYRQAGDINAAYARGNWKQIREGSKEQMETGRPFQKATILSGQTGEDH